MKKIKLLAEKILLKPVINIKQIIGKGEVNEVFIVELKDDKYILRINADEKTYDSYVKEKWCAEKAIKLGILTPEVFEIGVMDKVAYMLEEYIAGVNLIDTDIDRLVLFYELGVISKNIKKINVSGFGERLSLAKENTFFSDCHQGFDGSFFSYINYNINCLNENDDFEQLEIINKSNKLLVLNRLNSLLKKEFVFGLNHGDLSLHNVMLENNNYHLIDWGGSECNVSYLDMMFMFQGLVFNQSQIKELNDLGLPQNNDEMNAFLNGYGMSISDFNLIKDELLSLMLLRSFDKVRWALDCSKESLAYLVLVAKTVVKFIEDGE